MWRSFTQDEGVGPLTLMDGNETEVCTNDSENAGWGSRFPKTRMWSKLDKEVRMSE